jgi:hypothetical protein
MTMKKRITFYLAIVGLFLASCSPERVQYYEETDIVITKFEKDYNFVNKKTYAMPDSIVKVTGEVAEGEYPEFVDEPYNTKILNRIESNMSALGWIRVDNPENADLTLFPAVIFNTTIYYWSDYWCWYNPWYCGWGYDPYYGGAYSYSSGTMLMSLIANGNDYINPQAVWVGAINGLLSGAYDASRVDKGINQAFSQSPYLNVK